MLHLVIAFLIGAGLGFGVGRIKNAGKLAAISAELDKAEGFIGKEARKVVSAIRMKL